MLTDTSEARINQLEMQLAEAQRLLEQERTERRNLQAQLEKLGAMGHDAAEAMARIRLVHDTAEGARAAWRIARTWQEAHA